MSYVLSQSNQLVNDLNRFMDLFNYKKADGEVQTGQWSPAVDIEEHEKAYVISADIPGVDPKDIEIGIDNHHLVIRGERVVEKKETEASYSRTERVRGTFYRKFSLPENVDAEKITAASSHGVLQLTLPKIEKAQPKKIEVKVL